MSLFRHLIDGLSRLVAMVQGSRVSRQTHSPERNHNEFPLLIPRCFDCAEQLQFGQYRIVGSDLVRCKNCASKLSQITGSPWYRL